MRRRLVTALGAVAALAVAVLVHAPAAHATPGICDSSQQFYRTCSWYGPGNQTKATFEVQQSGTDVWATLYYQDLHGNRRNVFGVLYLQQCRGDGSACGTLAAVSGGDGSPTSVFILTTPTRTETYGHVYRGCGSVKDYTFIPEWDLLNVCSPFIVN